MNNKKLPCWLVVEDGSPQTLPECVPALQVQTVADKYVDAPAESTKQEENARANAVMQAAYDETDLNGKAINWRYWVLQMRLLTAAQAARLMSALEPDLFDDLNSRRGKIDPKREVQKARKIQRLAEGQGMLAASPSEWMEWALAHKLSVHVGFPIAVEAMHEAAKAAFCDEPNKGAPKAPPVLPATRRGQLDITRERGTRRRILEEWPNIVMEYGPQADGRQVLRDLNRDKDGKKIHLKTVQNHLSALRSKHLIP